MSIVLFVGRVKRGNLFPTRLRQWQGLRFVSSQALVVLGPLLCPASDICEWWAQVPKNQTFT